MMAYPVHLEPAEEGGFIVTFPDIPEAITQGEDEADALMWALDALETMLEVYLEERRPIPPPSPAKSRPLVTLPVVTAAKVLLHNTLLESGVSRAGLIQRLNLPPLMMVRLFSLRYKTRIEQLETALAALGKRLVVAVR